MPSRRPDGRRVLAVVAAYLALTIAFSWPLVTRLTTSLAADFGDAVFSAWVLTWVTRHLNAIAGGDLGAWAAMWQAPIFAPDPNTLTYSEHFLGQALQVLPITWVADQPLLLFNVIWIVTFALTGVAAHMLARHWSGSHLAGAVAGVTCMFSDYRLAFSISHLHTLSVHWWLFGLWGLDRFAATMSWRALAGATASLTMLHLSSAYLMAYSAPLTAAFAVWALWRHGRLADRRAWAGVIGAGVMSVIVVLPVLARYLATRDTLQFTRSAAEIAANSASLATYRATAWSVVPLVALAVVGAVGRGVTGGRVSRPARVGLLALAFTAVLLSFGPVIQLDGVMVRGPYQWLVDYVPGFAGLRVAQRYEVLALALWSVLAGLGAAWLARWRAGLVAVVAATAMAVQPVRITPFLLDRVIGTVGPPPPPAYLRPAADPPRIYRFARTLPPDAVLIELPFGDIGYDIRYTFFTLAHGRRIVNGYSGIQTPIYQQRAAILASPFTNRALTWRALEPASHVIVHDAGFNDDTGARLRDWLESEGGRALADADGAWLYALPPR